MRERIETYNCTKSCCPSVMERRLFCSFPRNAISSLPSVIIYLVAYTSVQQGDAHDS